MFVDTTVPTTRSTILAYPVTYGSAVNTMRIETLQSLTI